MPAICGWCVDFLFIYCVFTLAHPTYVEVYFRNTYCQKRKVYIYILIFCLHWVFIEVYGLLYSCGSWAYNSCPVACGILVPRPGIEPTSPALEGRFLITGPPGKSSDGINIFLKNKTREIY